MNSTGTSANLVWKKRPKLYGIYDTDLDMLQSNSIHSLVAYRNTFLGVLISMFISFLVAFAKFDRQDIYIAFIYLAITILSLIIVFILNAQIKKQKETIENTVKRIKRQEIIEDKQPTGTETAFLIKFNGE